MPVKLIGLQGTNTQEKGVTLYEIFIAGNISKICVKIQVRLNMTFVFRNLL